MRAPRLNHSFVAFAVALALMAAQSCAPSTALLDPRAVRTVRMGAVGGFAMNAGQTTQLVVTLLDSTGAIVVGRDVTYVSSDTTIAVVSNLGAIIARAPGISTLSARSGQASATARLTVAPATPSFAQIDVGGSGTCALTASGTPYCWRNQIGNFTGTSQGTPQLVVAPVAFQSVTVGNAHQCALSATGAAYCWGDNGVGQLGTGDTVSRTAPAPVVGGIAFTWISAGTRSTCGVSSNGTAYCWGFNASGELGNGSTTASPTPSPVSGSLHFLSVSVGGASACARASDGTYCWGDNRLGTLGDGDTISSAMPVRVSGGLTFEVVSADAAHACGVTSSGAAYCWGANLSGSLGIGTAGITMSSVPVRVAGNLTWRAISAGDMTCGISTTGSAFCWGSNLYDLLASGTPTNRSDVPALVWGGLMFRALSAHGGDHACGLGFDGFVYCWGAYVS